MSAFEDSLSLTDIARLAEVGVTAASNWRKRYPDFPAALCSSGQELYIAGEIVQWLSGRKIPKNSLKTGEVSGATYGDRFLRNLDISDYTAPVAVNAAKPRQVAERGKRLWAEMDLLRDRYDAVSSVELMMGLLYLRVREPELWRRLAHEPQEDVVQELLTRAELPSGPGAPRVPLFRMVAQTPMVDRSLIEVVHAVDGIDLGGSCGATFVTAQICDNLLTHAEHQMGRRGEHFIPDSLVRCMVELVDPRSRDLVYDPFCRFGKLLTGAAAHVERGAGEPGGLLVSGQALSEWSWRLTKLNVALHGVDVDLGTRPSHALHDDVFSGRQFDVILANPPFNTCYWAAPGEPGDQHWPYGVPPDSNSNFAWLQHVASRLVPGGRAAVLMANMATMTQNTAEAAIRARMVNAGVIDCVVALPRQLFRSTRIPVSLWLLRGVGDQVVPETLFIDATGMGAMADRIQCVLGDEDIRQIAREYHAWRDHHSTGNYEGTAGFARSVAHTEIVEGDYVLNPRTYVHPTVSEVRPERSLNQINKLRADLNDLRARSLEVRVLLDAQLAGITVGKLPDDAVPGGWAVVSLGEACEVLAGPGTVDRGRRQPSWTPLVLPRNIKQNRITDDELDAVAPQAASKLMRYRLAPGDVVCTRAGTLGRYGLVQAEQTDWLLGPGCMRLRSKERVDPGYLTYYLGSPVAYAWLMDNATGSAIRHISTKTLSGMPLALPPLPTQREIAAVLGVLDSEIAIHSQICGATQSLRDLLMPLLMTGVAQ